MRTMKTKTRVYVGLLIIAGIILVLCCTERKADDSRSSSAKAVEPAGKTIIYDLPDDKLVLPSQPGGEAEKGSELIPQGVREGIWFREESYFGYETTFFGGKDGSLWYIEVRDKDHMPWQIKPRPVSDNPYWGYWHRWYTEEYLPRHPQFPPK